MPEIAEEVRKAAYRQSAQMTLEALRSDESKGLTTEEAARRLEQYGRNELTAEKPVPAWRKFLNQFHDPLVILLLAAAAISTIVWVYDRHSSLPFEALAIFAIVTLNAVMGYVQTARAEEAIASLSAMSPTEARVVRDGTRRSLPAAELVPGDVLHIEEGDTIGADGRLFQSTSLKTAEAALTGESLPVLKDTDALEADAPLGDRHNMIFSGTVASYGHGSAVVTATGMETEMGRIAGLLRETKAEVTPLQHQLNRTGRMLGIVVIAIAVVMIATILLTERANGIRGLMEALIFGVALAVAAVPEGLPAVVTAVLARGVQRMAKRKAIVRKLAAVESLGSANIIASDKTGTLTRNEMTVRKVVTASGTTNISGTGYAPEGEVTGAEKAEVRHELEKTLTGAARANNAEWHQENGKWKVLGDPTEGSLLVAAAKAGLKLADLDQRYPRTGEVPFSSERKLMTTTHRDPDDANRQIAFVKGAPDVLLAKCTRELRGHEEAEMSEDRRSAILQETEKLAGEALRTLAVAYRPLENNSSTDESIEQNLVFAGLVGMIDPPREEAKQAIAVAKKAGIRSMMITGDHPGTASVIGRELGIAEDGRTLTGSDIENASEEDLRKTVQEVFVYARVNPEHKLRLVKAMQANGAVVGMTGDGVNDAPALKAADIGIAMGITGTDVSKQAADMVLADDNFATIVAAVEGGRSIFANIRKFLRFLLSSNIGEVITMFFGVLLAKPIGLQADANGLSLPLAATHILWINLVTDGAPALALGLDPPDGDEMSRPPRNPGEPAITRKMWRSIGITGSVMAAGTLFILYWSIAGGRDLKYAQTMAFTTLMLFQMFNTFSSRSDETTAFRGVFRNRWLWLAIGASIALQLAVLYIPFLQQAFSTAPLGASDWLKCVVIASSVLWVSELSKLLLRAKA